MASLSMASSFLPLLLLAGALIVVATVWLIRFRNAQLFLLAFSLLAGQLIRVPLPGQGGGLLLSDIAVLIVLFSIFLDFIRHRHELDYIKSQSALVILFLFLPFIFWSGFTLIINSSWLLWSQILIAASYWIRLTAYLLVFPALIWRFARYPHDRIVMQKYFLWAVYGVIGLGLIQLLFLPQLDTLGKFGWDPHQFRLVSTWLDPNFVGGFLCIGLFTLLAYKTRLRPVSVFVTLSALILTRSRSSWLALLLVILLISPVMIFMRLRRLSRPRLVLTASLFSLLGLFLTLFILFLGNRALGLITYDPTVQLRQSSLLSVWQIVQTHPFVGVGYNAYQFTALQSGLISDFNIHSRAGADNSFLTLWVTTGLIGVILFCLPWVVLIWLHFRHYLRINQALSFAVICAILFLFFQAQFVNSFLYAHLLLSVIILSAISFYPVSDHCLSVKTIRPLFFFLPRRIFPISFLICLIPAYLIRFRLFNIPTNLFEVFVLIYFCFILIIPSCRKKCQQSTRQIPLLFLLTITFFVIASIVSVIISPNLLSSLGVLKGWIIIPLIFGWLVFVSITPNNAKSFVILPLAFIGAFSALISLSQLGTTNRIYGWYDVPNSLALWLAPIFVLTFWGGLNHSRYHRLFLYLSLPIAIALLATQSVSGMIAIIISLGSGACFWISSISRRHVLIILALSLVIIISYLSVTNRLNYLFLPLTEHHPNSISVRFQLWDVSLTLLSQHGLLGIGLGQFEPAYQSEIHRRFAVSYKPTPLPEFVFRDPHNLFFSFWLNTGIIGLASFLALLFIIFRYTFHSKNLTSNQKGLILALICLLVFGLSDTIYWKNDLSVLFWLLIFLLLKYSHPGSWHKPSLHI